MPTSPLPFSRTQPPVLSLGGSGRDKTCVGEVFWLNRRLKIASACILVGVFAMLPCLGQRPAQGPMSEVQYRPETMGYQLVWEDDFNDEQLDPTKWAVRGIGPRALGSRSIIGDARSRDMQSVMNLKIKFRESFRPFAPIVLRERVSEFFEMRDQEDSPYMLLVAPVAPDKRLSSDDGTAEGLDKLKVIRSQVPAITHVDLSARVQTVDAERHGMLYRLMKAFEERTGCPVMINTSFNVRGEPIVCSPEHAYHCFMGTDMDVLVLENHLLLKERQPKSAIPRRDEYPAQFALD